MRGASPPGSTTIALPASSSPKIVQLHPSGATEKVSTIIFVYFRSGQFPRVHVP